jgi:hypothetical protein
MSTIITRIGIVDTGGIITGTTIERRAFGAIWSLAIFRLLVAALFGLKRAKRIAQAFRPGSGVWPIPRQSRGSVGARSL